jgi:prolyl-tRNA editing enzyme YbaK/EbsC (Cys-tRNA(Pro) deacylase)
MDDNHDMEQRVVRHLDALGATYAVMECDPDLADTAAFCEAYGVAPEDSANAILVASKRPPGHYAMGLVLATTRLDVNRAVRDLMGVRKLSFANAEVTAEKTGMLIGGVTPFGAPDDIPIYVDERVIQRPEVIVGGGSRSKKVRLDPEVFTRMPHVQVVPNLAKEIRVPATEEG